MKKGIKVVSTTICILVFAICIVIANKDKLPKKDSENSSTRATSSETAAGGEEKETEIEKPTVERPLNQPAKVILNTIQICESNETVLIKYSNDAVEYVVGDTVISRELRDEYKEVVELNQGYYEAGVLDENMTFNKGFFYMYVNFTMTNRSQRPKSLLPSSLSPFIIDIEDGKYVGTDYFTSGSGTYGYSYAGVDGIWDISCVAGKQTQGEDYLDGPLGVRQFEIGETAGFEVVIVISEEFVEKDNIYYYDTFGASRGKLLSDINQRYIKANIINRGDYYDDTN